MESQALDELSSDSSDSKFEKKSKKKKKKKDKSEKKKKSKSKKHKKKKKSKSRDADKERRERLDKPPLDSRLQDVIQNRILSGFPGTEVRPQKNLEEERILMEVASGKRESDSKLPYGLYDPKKQKLNDDFSNLPSRKNLNQTAVPATVTPDLHPESSKVKLTASEQMKLLLEKPTTSSPTSRVKEIAKQKPVPFKDRLNKLVAQGMRAQLMGDSAKYQKITEEIANLKERMKNEPDREIVVQSNAEEVIAPVDEKGQILHSLTKSSMPAMAKEDLRSRRRRGIMFHEDKVGPSGTVKANFTSDLKGKDESIQQMLARERLTKKDSLDDTYIQNVIKQGSRFKDSGLSGRRQGLEGEELDISLYESKKSTMTERRVFENDKKRALVAHQKAARAESMCPFSFRNPSFRKDLVVFIGKHLYVMLPFRSITTDHCRIVPIEPLVSFTAAEEDVWAELKFFKRIIEAKATENELSLVYMETVKDASRAGWHTFVECVPVDAETGEMVPMFFKKALLESDSEWSTHKKVIDTSKKGLRRSIPQTFPYFNIEWAGGGYSPGGYVHVIESPIHFPSSFGIDVLSGAMGKDPSRFNRFEQTSTALADNLKVQTFKKDWARISEALSK